MRCSRAESASSGASPCSCAGFLAVAGLWATLIGDLVVAHRMFDLFPTIALVIWVLSAADVPHWALMTLAVVLGIGVAAFALALVAARRHHARAVEGLGRVRLLLAEARRGLAIMRAAPGGGLAAAVTFQIARVALPAPRRLGGDERVRHPRAVSPPPGLVLLLVNVISVFPFWPGNVGLVQAGIAVSLAQYGVGYARGFAYGIGLQAIEASVGIGIGRPCSLAREGLSYGMLKQIEPDENGRAAGGHQREQIERPSRTARISG